MDRRLEFHRRRRIFWSTQDTPKGGVTAEIQVGASENVVLSGSALGSTSRRRLVSRDPHTRAREREREQMRGGTRPTTSRRGMIGTSTRSLLNTPYLNVSVDRLLKFRRKKAPDFLIKLTRFPHTKKNKEKVVVVVMSNCTQACMCSGWCFWTYFTAIANAIGASFVVGSFDHLPSFSRGKLQNFLHCLSSSTTLLPLRWICATPPSLSKGTLFTKFFRGPLFERAKRTA